MELSTLKDGNLSFCCCVAGKNRSSVNNCLIAAKSPVNKTHDKIIASYSKMQEAHLYAKFKGEIYTPYIGISLVRSSGCFYKGNYFYDFFWWWWVDFFFLLLVEGGGLK